MNYESIIKQLEEPTGYKGTNSEDSYETYDPLRLTAAVAIRNLLGELDVKDKILQGKLEDVRLLSARPGDEGFEIEMTGGVVNFIAKYMLEMLNMDTESPLNYVSMNVSHHKLGEANLTVQRVGGKTPSTLHGEALAEVERLKKIIAEGDTVE